MALLVVDLLTDYRPRFDFRWIEVHLIKRRTRKRMQENYIDFLAPRPGNYRRGVRLTEVRDLDRGAYQLVVRLLRDNGRVLGMRVLSVTVRGDTAVTAPIVR